MRQHTGPDVEPHPHNGAHLEEDQDFIVFFERIYGKRNPLYRDGQWREAHPKKR